MFKNTFASIASLFLVLVTLLLGHEVVYAQKYKKAVIQNLDNNQNKYGQTAHQIWEWAEVGYQETKSSSLLQEILKSEGFSIETGVGYLWEDVADIEGNYLTFRVAQRAEVKLGEKSKAWETLEYLPKADEIDDYLLTAEIGIEAAATGQLALRLAIQNKHDSTPAPDKEKTDTVVIAALSWTL
jgi:hypothetical protein